MPVRRWRIFFLWYYQVKNRIKPLRKERTIKSAAAHYGSCAERILHVILLCDRIFYCIKVLEKCGLQKWLLSCRNRSRTDKGWKRNGTYRAG